MFEDFHPPKQVASPQAQPRKNKAIIVLGLPLMIAAAVAVGYLYLNLQQTKQELEQVKRDPQAAATKETNQLIEEVSKKIALPEDEQPTVATVTDKEKLKDQPFFAKAENNDKLLIYPNAKKVYLYRPSAEKVIEVGTINLTGSGNQPPRPAE